MLKLWTILSFTGLLLLQSCYYDNLEDLVGSQCVELPERYSEAVVVILSKYCYECHSDATKNSLGAGIGLENYQDVKTTVDDGSLMGSIEHVAGYSPMPRNRAKLLECDIEKIRVWIQEGAEDN